MSKELKQIYKLISSRQVIVNARQRDVESKREVLKAHDKVAKRIDIEFRRLERTLKLWASSRTNPKNIDWGVVGSLEAIEMRIKEANEFNMGEPK